MVGEQSVRWPITVSIPPGAPPLYRAEKDEYGKVILETTHPDYPEFVIQVSFLVTK
jgi:hypothetical protein